MKRFILILMVVQLLLFISCRISNSSGPTEAETSGTKPAIVTTLVASPIPTQPVTGSTSAPAPEPTPLPTIDEFMQHIADAIDDNNPGAVLEAIHPEERGKFNEEILEKGILLVKTLLKEQEINSIKENGSWHDENNYQIKEFDLSSNNGSYWHFSVGVRPDGGFTICDKRFLLAAGMTNFLEEYIDKIHSGDPEQVARLIYPDDKGNKFSIDETKRLIHKHHEAFGENIPAISFSQNQEYHSWPEGIDFDIKSSEQVHRITLLESPIKEFLVLDNWLELPVDFSLYFNGKIVVGTSIDMEIIKELFGDDVKIEESEIRESPFTGSIRRDISCTGLSATMVVFDNSERVIDYEARTPLLSTTRAIHIGDTFMDFNVAYPDAIVNYMSKNQYQATISDGEEYGLEMVFYLTDGILESIKMLENIP